MDIVLHPEFTTGKPYVYLLYVFDPVEAPAPDQAFNRNARLTRVRAQQVNGVWSVVPNSEEILLGKNSTWANISDPTVDSTENLITPPSGVTVNPDGSVTNLQDYIAVDSQSHGPGSVLFGADGQLYVTIGDGTSYNQTDARTLRVQDIGNLSGKVLRINPDTGEGLADNPFWDGNGNANQSKVFALGVRNGFRSVIGPAGQLVVADVGWNTYEEVNIVTKGANLGWPYFEGSAAGVPQQTGGYKDLAAAQAFYAAGTPTTAPSYTYNHNGLSSAILAGDFYTGTNPIWQNSVFVNDVSQGWVKALTFDQNGVLTQERNVATGVNAQSYIVDMNMGADGNMYYVNLLAGTISRWVL
jgi:glucose/arabinose dehydrogenase